MRKTIIGASVMLAMACALRAPAMASDGQQSDSQLYMPGINYNLPAVLVTAADIARTKSEMEEKKQVDIPIRMVDCGGDGRGHQVGVSLVVRFKGQRYSGAVHDQVSEVYHILGGAGTMLVGGKLTNPKRRPTSGGNGPGIEGDGVDGGVKTPLTKGDVLIIPAGTPHQFVATDDLTWYTVVRVDPGKVTPLR